MDKNTHKLPAKKHIALVAHDGKKPSLESWCKKHQIQLSKHMLCATGTTGNLIEKTTGLTVEKLLSGPMGGDQQIGSRIAALNAHTLIFFWAPLASQPHDPDVTALLRLAYVRNIPVACNEATAAMSITSLNQSE